MDFLYGMFFLYKDSFFDIFLILKQKLKCTNSCSCFLYSRGQTSGGSACFNRYRHPQNFRHKNRPWRFLNTRGQTPGGSACFNRCRNSRNFRLKNRPWRFLNTWGQTPGGSVCFNDAVTRKTSDTRIAHGDSCANGDRPRAEAFALIDAATRKTSASRIAHGDS